jgi:hypothetical protein
MLVEPLSPPKAKQLILDILKNGTVWTSKHAEDEMRKDNLTVVDAANVLRGGTVLPGEWENGSWRYRVRTARMVFVVAFDSETELAIVTGWRLR